MRRARLRRGFVGIVAALAAVTSAGSAFGAFDYTPRIKPPPPGPVFGTRSDLDALREVQKAVARRDYTGAKIAAQGVADPIAKSLAEWIYFNAEDPLVDLSAAGDFLDRHPDWPAVSKIQMHAERRIPNTTSAAKVLSFFDTRDPLTGEGKVQLARAELATGNEDAAEIHLRDAWINNSFTLADEQQLLAKYSGRLSAEDHAARVDRLLWSREVTAARRVFSRLGARDRRMAEARAALLVNASSGRSLFNSLSDDERRDSGVLLAAVRYYRRAKEEPRAIALARQAPTEPSVLRNAARWWAERQLLMRWALTEHQYADAYAMAAGHGLAPGGEFAEAEFAAGWIALRYLNAPERAETHFLALANAVGAPISVSRAYYWLGRAAEARGAAGVAQTRYQRAATFVYTYYGQLAAERLGGAATQQAFAAPTSPTPEEKARFSSRPVVAALRLLSELDDDQAFLVFAYHADDELESPGEYVELARLADRKGATHITVRAGKVGIGRNAFAAEVAYPLIFVPDEATQFAPPEIILGLSRQESEFNPRAYSRAGARGLMQLIPSTAQITARRAGLRYSRSALLDDPVYNLIVGSAHLSQLFERFNGSRVMTFAAYNAGAARVDQWIERYGDPRSAAVDPIDWIEQIPFEETRNYVQRVLENTQVYRSRLTGAPLAGRLAADLELGGPSKRAGFLPNLKFAEILPPVPDRTLTFASATLDAAGAEENAPSAPASPNGEDEEDVIAFNDDLSESDRADFIGDAPRAITTAKKSPSLNQHLRRPKQPQSPTAALAPGEPAPGDNSAAALNAASLERSAPPETAISDPATVAPAPSQEPAPCETYRAYISATDREDASAADLNAGMLAELEGGGAACAPATDAPESAVD